jgi:hypothetical protein
MVDITSQLELGKKLFLYNKQYSVVLDVVLIENSKCALLIPVCNNHSQIIDRKLEIWYKEETIKYFKNSVWKFYNRDTDKEIGI